MKFLTDAVIYGSWTAPVALGQKFQLTALYCNKEWDFTYALHKNCHFTEQYRMNSMTYRVIMSVKFENQLGILEGAKLLLLISLWIVIMCQSWRKSRFIPKCDLSLQTNSYTFSSNLIPAKLGICPFSLLFESILEFSRKKCYQQPNKDVPIMFSELDNLHNVELSQVLERRNLTHETVVI